MTTSPFADIDPTLDLTFERSIDITPAQAWAAWTTPDLLVKWFCPKPWTTTTARIDLRPGGEFHTVMRSPEGQEHANNGCYLDVVPNERLVWTNALLAGFRPADAPAGMPLMTVTIALQADGGGTFYRAKVLHRNAKDRDSHAAMGFETGWGMALDQLVAMVKGN